MKKITFFQIITIIVTLLTIIVNGLANTLPINGQGTGEISDRFSIYFVPAGYVFSIWGLIYIGILGFMIYQALPAQLENRLIRKISPAYWISSFVNIAWIFLWHYEYFTFTLPVMITLLASLLYIYIQISKARSDLTVSQKWFVKFPFSIYLGWISVATIANVSQVLFFLGWGGWGIPPTVWAVIMLIIASGLGILMNWREKDALYVLVLVWAFVGIAVSQAETSMVAITALTAAIVLVFAIVTRPVVAWLSPREV